MIRSIRKEEVEKVLNWHFRYVDQSPGGRNEYARRFAVEYLQAVNTINGATGLVLVYEHEGQIVGYIGARIDKKSYPHRAFMCGFYIEPHMRRNGYGRALAEEAISVLRKKGVTSLSVEVGLSKPWLIEFYQRVGFVKSSVLMYQRL